MKTRRLLVKALFSAVFSLFAIVGVKANNVQITGTSISGSNITFNISWENSWNASAAPANWDAVWVFVKYQDCNTKLWAHADLSTTASDHTAASPLQVDPVTDGKGVFIRRSAVGGGNIASTSITLKMSSVSGTANNYKVYGIEMVNIPQGAFQIGDGVSGNSYNSITIDNTSQTNGLTAAQIGGVSVAVPSTFPMGYNSFYCMKYEISQEQYADFLNSLTFDQQKNRVVTDPISPAGSYAMNSTYQWRNGLAIQTPGSNGAIPAVFGCDATAGTVNGTNDGQNIAMNFLSWDDVAAYLDWSALRPMTEIEYEKICRGTLPRVAGEYAWGSADLTQIHSGTGTNGISNSLMNNETANSVNNGNCAYGVQGNIGLNPAYGPLRVGIFATNSSGRLSSGAGYYGVMEMSGNVYERVISTIATSGTTFTGVLGDGTLTSIGFANQSNWPNNSTSQAFYLKGGSFLDSSPVLRVSDRAIYNYGATRLNTTGGRGVR